MDNRLAQPIVELDNKCLGKVSMKPGLAALASLILLGTTYPVMSQTKMRSGVADYLNLYYLMKSEGRVDCGYIAGALMQLDNNYYMQPSKADRAETISLAKQCGLRGIPSR